MKLDREKIIENSKNTLDIEYLEMLNRLSDYEICKYMLWDKVHSIIYDLVMKIQSNISIFILCIQIAALFTKVIAVNRGLSDATLYNATIIARTTILVGLFINIAIQILIHRFHRKALNEIRIINEYSDLIRDTVTEEINKINELKGK